MPDDVNPPHTLSSDAASSDAASSNAASPTPRPPRLGAPLPSDGRHTTAYSAVTAASRAEADTRFAFDAYFTVDWSANKTPKQGPDSVWWCLALRDARGVHVTSVANPSTRDEAIETLRALLVELTRRGTSVFVGFDFAYGYPRGLARALGLEGPPWLATWRHLANEIRDEQRLGQRHGRNNRFEVASSMNRRLGGTGPFWGCPDSAATPHLRTKGASPLPFEKYRSTEKGGHGAQPTWKLFTAGSVGSQVLLGLPRLHALRTDPALESVSRVWPFETGPRLPAREPGVARIVHAEIYPSLVHAEPGPGQVLDEAQVIAQAIDLARRDTEGTLAELFAAPARLSPEDLAAVVNEEGWILGVTST